MKAVKKPAPPLSSEEAYNPSPLEKINRDILKAAKDLSDQEVRFLVDYYYIMQEDRKRSFNQERALEASGEPNHIITWLAGNSTQLEGTIKKALEKYTDNHPVGKWLKGIYGVGAIIAAGMISHIDITKAPTAGHIWAYAGLDPTKKWEKGEVRPWNANLKALCWKTGECFVKFSGKEQCVYGKLYKEKKEWYTKKNEEGGFKEVALKRKDTVKKNTDAYKWYAEGKLPPAHIHAMARRFAVKIFLSHLHEVWYKHHFKVDPPAPYPIAILGHAHKIEPIE